jgi:hypothetical protein
MKLSSIIDKLIYNFYLYTEDCKNNLDNIFDLIPVSWNIDKENMKTNMHQHLFSDKWKRQCEATFRTYIQSFIKN